ncbi:MAG TPA: helix-turn-helix domain-containing protein [Kiritimatiellia bacterium]|jgi:excisionase family DNA binding protein|nr:hypothetical protein [Limisphaerales bacterium]HNR72296.1 helix-turn-helix domain-containing protein [Verrucomicrobiota bacterium]HRV30684.1 helix-turn-helix domain-containing protein [Kiritimatiellia bacterium]HRY58791.1 helix-turn-helix domain-containing protein [Candidatus Paceibacterota bacterium]HNS70830.1 helix-turn-helix domain-containing protein [Verrucomicrobiota bacterium]
MRETEDAVPSEKKRFYSLEQVAELLGVNYQLIYKLVRAGELPAARIGKVYRVVRSDLDRYIEQSKGHAAGGVCSVCGNRYQSRLSLKHECVDCGGPICVDCWSRKKARRCPAHGRGGAAGTKMGNS